MNNMELQIKVFDTTVPITEKESFQVLKRDILPVLEPTWIPEDIQFEILAKGSINMMIVCSSPEDVAKRNATVVRIYGDKGSVHESRDLEIIKMQIGYYAGCFGEVLASFENGCIYRYSPGRCLRKEELHDPNIIREGATMLAKFHYIDLSSLPLVNRKGEQVTMEIKKDYYVQKLKDYIHAASDNLTNLDSKTRQMSEQFLQDYRREVSYVENLLNELDLPLANCHGSFHPNNILYDESSGKITFVDYEFGGYGNIAMFDYAYLFMTYRYASYIGQLDLSEVSETEEIKMLWLKTYLESKHRIHGRGDSGVSTRELERWKVLLDMMNGLTSLSNAGRWHNLTPHCEADKAMSSVAFQIYQEVKPQLPALREHFLHLSSRC